MEPRSIPKEELKTGEFYDIQSIDQNPRVFGALLLEQLPNSRAKLLFMSASGFDRFAVLDSQLVLGWRVLQVDPIQLGLVFPYLTFTQLPDKILRWPNNFEGEELIYLIREEMYRAVREGHWVFKLPFFYEGYLHIYMSYIRWKDNCPRRVELIDLWFEFMGAYFSILRDHLLKVNLLSTETIRGLLKVLKGMHQMSEMTLELREIAPNQLFTQKEKELVDTVESFFEAYRPPELSSGKLDNVWKLISREYRQDLITWQLQKPLNLRILFLKSYKFIYILNSDKSFVRDFVHENCPGLQSEESFRIKMCITVATRKFTLAYSAFTHSDLASDVKCRIMLEEKLLDPILGSSCGKSKTFVMTQIELFPWVLNLLKSSDKLCISFYNFLKCVIARTALKDFSFLTFVIEHKFLTSAFPPNSRYCVKMHTYVKELLTVFLNQKMSPELLLNLLPHDPYDSLVFQAFSEDFLLTKKKEIMINYFGSEQRCIETARNVLKTFAQISEKSANRKVHSDIKKSFSLHLMKKNVWYVFGGSVQIQFIWMRQSSLGFIKRLSPGLTREICTYLA